MRKHNITARTLLIIAALAVLFSLPLACGKYHEADIAGYVKDSANGYGVNGVTLKAYLTEEEAEEGTGALTETSSMIYNGNPGYFIYTILWQKLVGAYGSEGDATDIWISAEQEDYVSKIVEVKGITSGTLNVIPDIQLDAVVYTAQQVSGLVVDGVGDGVDGVRVVLDLASTDTNPDYVAVSSTTQVGDTTQAGMYTFVNVKWRDEDNPGQMTDEESVTISVDDSVYTGNRELERTITSGTGVMMMDAGSAIVVSQ